MLSEAVTEAGRPKVERLVAEQLILDTLHFFASDRLECVRRLGRGETTYGTFQTSHVHTCGTLKRLDLGLCAGSQNQHQSCHGSFESSFSRTNVYECASMQVLKCRRAPVMRHLELVKRTGVLSG